MVTPQWLAVGRHEVASVRRHCRYAGRLTIPVAKLEQEILGGQILTGTSQNDCEVSRGISVDVSLDDRVAIDFKPGHAVGDHVGVLTSEFEGLVPCLPAAAVASSLANIRIDRRQVDHIR